MVIPRAIIRDLHTGHEAARLMATTMLVFSVSPILAPLAGSTLTAFFSWRVIFWAIAAIGLAGLAVVVFLLPETHKPGEERRGLAQAFATYGRLLKDRRFLGLAFIGGFSQASFFAYLAGSSVIFIEHFGLSPSAYSMIFASNAIAFIGSAQFNSIFMRRFGAERVVRTAISGFAMLVTLLFVLTVLGVDNAFVLWGLLFSSFGCLGYRHSLDGGARSRGAWPDRRNGLGAHGHPAARHRRRDHRAGQRCPITARPLSMVSAIFVCALVALTLSFRIMKPKRDLSLTDLGRGSSRGRSAAAASPPCAPDRRDNRRRR